jgi:hypothetical protein
MIPGEPLAAFLLRAKRATYAGGVESSGSSRPSSHDLPYQEGAWFYLDSYLGGFKFAGEEIVWKDGTALWGMNYYGRMVSADIPSGFSQFLKLALRNVPAEAPFRGPARFTDGDFSYRCAWSGNLGCFQGEEWIDLREETIYRLVFHGGYLLD